MIPGDAIRRAMAEDVQFAMAVTRDLAGGFRSMVRAVKNQKLRSGVERLANYLIMLRASDANVGANVILRHEKRILASLLGMTPENLSRAFAALRKHGVSVNGSVVTIANAGALRAIAKPDPLIDNHAPRGGEVVTSADAEIWSTLTTRAETAKRAVRQA
jgi:CRP/FNR family transcriptional activator FtrB